MKNIQIYHENVQRLLLQAFAELEADIDEISFQLSDDLYHKAGNIGWRASARKARKAKTQKRMLIGQALKLQNRKLNTVMLVISQIKKEEKKRKTQEAHQKLLDKHERKNQKVEISKKHFISLVENEETLKAFRAKLKESIDMDDYIDFCRSTIEPIQEKIRTEHS